MRAYERLLRYVKVHTTSDEESASVPTTSRQFDLAVMVADELKALGLSDAHVDGNSYVYAHIPATPGCEDKAKIGFIAHLDTAPDFSGENVKPVIYENYDGGDVVLGDSCRVLKVSDFPHLAGLKGATLITTDGTTLLGADDKAGIAEIITAVETLLASGEAHGPVSIAFTPDEEVGEGATHFDIGEFGAEFAYTVDGGDACEIEYETFNAASATVEFNGFNIHPGSAKDKLVNAQLLAMEFNSMLPAGETPAHTEGREGFFHLCGMEGNVEKAVLVYIIRDHDKTLFEHRQEMVNKAAELMNAKYGAGTVKATIRQQYLNMYEKIVPNFHIVEIAQRAISKLGMTPRSSAVRGGTDGARLSYMGLPCPNIGTGGHAFHGPFEHIAAESMDKCVDVILGIIREVAK